MVVQPTIRDAVEACYRRKWSMLLVMLVVAGLSAVSLANAVPIYRSQAVVVVRFTTLPVPTSNLSTDRPPDGFGEDDKIELIETHLQILQSEYAAEQTITRIGLDRIYPDIVAKPPSTGTPLDAAIKRFIRAVIVVSLPGNELRISYENEHADVARDALTALIDVFTTRETAIFTDGSIDFEQHQADIAAQRLAKAQAELSAFKATAGISDFDVQLTALITERVDLENRLHMAQVALARSTQQQDALGQTLQTISATVTLPAGGKYGLIDSTQARIDGLQTREREMTALHGLDWPAAQALRASIGAARRANAAMVAAATDRLQPRRNPIYLGIQTDLLRATAQAQSDRQAVALMTTQATGLARDIAALEAKRDALMERQRELDLAGLADRAAALHLQDARIDVDRAHDGISRVAFIAKPDRPLSPLRPRYKVEMMAGAAAALYAGLFAVFLLEYFDDRFISADQITDRLRIPVLATFDKV